MKRACKRVFAAALCLVLALSLLPVVSVSAAVVDTGSCGKSVTYKLYDDGRLVIDGAGDMYDYDPGRYSPFFDDPGAFLSVVIGDGVTSVGAYMFYYCARLISVSIPDSVKRIGDEAFSGCYSLVDIEIPDSVTSIGSSAFSECVSLESVTIPKGVKRIEYGTFFACTSMTSVTIPQSVTYIASNAFENCTALKLVTIPEGVTEINSSVFQDCDNLTSVTIPVSVTRIDRSAFKGCDKLETVKYGGTVADWHKIRISDGNEPLTRVRSHHEWDGKVTTAPTCTDKGVRTFTCTVCGSTKTETIPASGHVWDDGTVLTPATCTEIGLIKYTCTVCGSTKTETIPASGHVWDDGAVTTPATCTEDGAITYTCATCGETRTETIPARHKDGDGDFICDVCGEEAVVDQGKCGENITYVLYADGTLILSGTGEMYFYDIAYDPSPFYDDGRIRSVVIGDGVTNIGRDTFLECDSLADINIPASVTSIGAHAFEDCMSLADIYIPSSVTSIGYWAFADCKALERVTIPVSVTWIGGWAFDDCDKLETVYYGGTSADWQKIAIDEDGNDALKKAAIVSHPVHDWDGGAVTAAPTCAAEGVKTFTCAVCGETKTEPVAKDAANHTGSAEVRDAKEATCGAAGYTGDTYCKGCGAKLSDGIATDPTGDHKDENKDGKCDVCGEKTGEVTPPAPAGLRGDADLDGKVTARDARSALRASAKLDTLTPQGFANCDLDGDNKITAKEARLILRFSAKLEKEI